VRAVRVDFFAGLPFGSAQGKKSRASIEEKDSSTGRGAKKTDGEDAGFPGADHRDAESAKARRYE